LELEPIGLIVGWTMVTVRMDDGSFYMHDDADVVMIDYVRADWTMTLLCC
jgi:hypothetical protein